MSRPIHGVIRGKTIQLDEDLGAAEGQEVEVVVKMLPGHLESRGGVRRSAGALADDPYWDAIMNGIYVDRKRDTRREAPQ